jgi:hypothetical protein
MVRQRKRPERPSPSQGWPSPINTPSAFPGTPEGTNCRIPRSRFRQVTWVMDIYPLQSMQNDLQSLRYVAQLAFHIYEVSG